MRAIVIWTNRLVITPRAIEAVEALRDQEPDADMRNAYQEMVDTMRALPDCPEWGAEWTIALKDGTVIGGICFKGAPDERGMVEIGYGIDEAYRCNGYATEAVVGVTNWALGQSGVKFVTAQTAPENEVSQRVLLRSGYVRMGDGAEGPLFGVTRVDTQEF